MGMQGLGGGPKGRRRGLELGVSERRREGEEWEEKSGILYAAPQNPRKLLQRLSEEMRVGPCPNMGLLIRRPIILLFLFFSPFSI